MRAQAAKDYRQALGHGKRITKLKNFVNGEEVNYQCDALYKRVTEVKGYPVAGGAEDTCQKTKYFYDVNTFDGSFSLNAWGRMVVSEYSVCSPAGLRTIREMYSYTVPGLVGKKRFRVDKQKVHSPGQGMAGGPRSPFRRSARRRVRG